MWILIFIHWCMQTAQAEEQARKREIRLMKNREAARECRNKKKEYIKCLENRLGGSRIEFDHD